MHTLWLFNKYQFRLELGFNHDKLSVTQEAKNIVSFPSEFFCVGCLGLGWLF